MLCVGGGNCVLSLVKFSSLAEQLATAQPNHCTSFSESKALEPPLPALFLPAFMLFEFRSLQS